jgi:S1-C subfamily serine protease
MVGHDTVRPRVSRETRRLLTAAALALVTLWVLARIRFPDEVARPNPVAPVLNQIGASSGFPDLAAEVDRVRRRVIPLLSEVRGAGPAGGEGQRIPAWPLADGTAATVLASSGVVGDPNDVLAHDPVSGLTLVRTDTTPGERRVVWTPAELSRPRYLFAVTSGPRGPSVVPAYVSSLVAERSAVWPGEIWTVPAAIGLQAGSLVFTSAGEWLGIVTEEESRLAIVPAEMVLIRSDELRHAAIGPPGDLGVRVQDLTAAIAASTKTASGVIVTWVDPNGPASDTIAVGDVIESVDGQPVPTAFAWEARMRRLVAKVAVHVKRHRSGEAADVTVMSRHIPHSSDLGLALVRSGMGSRVVRVAEGSAGQRAGLQPDDVLTAVGTSPALLPEDLREQFGVLPPKGTLLISVARGDGHHIAVLAR